MNRCYYGTFKDGDIGFSIVAPTAKDAKVLLWNSGSYIRELCDGDYTALRIKWKRHVHVSDLLIGYVFGLIEGLERGAYSSGEDDCPECRQESLLQLWPDGKVSCEYCWEQRGCVVDYDGNPVEG